MPAQSASEAHTLLPHPSSAPGDIRGLAVTVERTTGDSLTLRYRLSGDIGALRLPEPRLPVRADGLWRHTCFEAFIGHPARGDYWEYNVSPSGAWAAYHFTAYREGMAPLLKGAPPGIVVDVGSEALEVSVLLDLSWLARSSAGPGLGFGLRLGLAAVVETQAQVLSYWALKHPAEKPDFHHADGFVVALD